MESINLNFSTQPEARLIRRKHFAKFVRDHERSFVRNFKQMTDADRANSFGLIHKICDQEQEVAIWKFSILKNRA